MTDGSTEDDRFIRVPVLRNFDSADIIGWMHVRKDALPPSPEYVFSIGYVKKDKNSYQLISVSPVHVERLKRG